MGVAQVPIGLAGPLRINGEHARATSTFPMATSEGTLVASYNRGMRLLSESGGVKTTVGRPVHAALAGVLLRRRAAGARLRRLGQLRLRAIKQVAETTTRSAS
jgi:hydroxymethylglutaryl-CoA reductase (NADPH)